MLIRIIYQMNIENIRFIEAIVTEGSIRKAAEKLFISQPAISAAIKKLEQELNIEIFDKESYRAVLTQDGMAFYERAKKVLAEFNKLEEYGQSLKKGIEPEFRIAIEAVFNIEKILPVLNTVMEKFPETKITITVDYMEKVADYLDKDNYDLIISPESFVEKPEMGLEKMFLEDINLYHVIAPGCPLARRKNIREEDLKLLPQVVIRNGTEKSTGVLEETRKWYVNDFFLKKIIIMQGNAWGMIPEHYMKQELKEKKLIPLKSISNFKPFKLSFFAFRNKNIRHGVVALSIWKALTESCQEN
jgi:DNA-binding transcriptional LysR family regulator